MARLARNLIAWFVYSFIMFFILYPPLSDMGFRNVSKICIPIVIGFFAGMFNDIIRQLMIINNYNDYAPIPGQHLLDFTNKMRSQTFKILSLKNIITLYMWSCFNKKRFRHYVLCMVYNHNPTDSFNETSFACVDTIVDRVSRKNIDKLTYKGK